MYKKILGLILGLLLCLPAFAGSPYQIDVDKALYGAYFPGGGATFSSATIDTLTSGQVNVGNLRLDGNTLSSTNANGNINLDPNGNGNIINTVTSSGYHLIDLNNGGTGADARTSKWYMDATYMYNDVYRGAQLHRVTYGQYVLQILSSGRGGLNVGSTEASVYSVNAVAAVVDAGGTGKAIVRTAANDIELTPVGGNVNITVNGLKMAGTTRLTTAGGVIVQANTTANRPGSPAIGQIYFDTNAGKMIVYNGSAWVNMDGTAL